MSRFKSGAKRGIPVAGLVAALLAGAGCDDYGMADMGLGGWGYDAGWSDPYHSDFGYGGYGPIDPDVFQSSVDAFSEYIRG